MINQDADKIVALHDEQLEISRRRVARDTVRVSTVTTQFEQHVAETLSHARVEVTRVPVGRVVDRVPDIREEDGLTIVPVVEEEIVIHRRLVLKEEVHLRRVMVDDLHQETVVLRSQDAVISRIPAGTPPDGEPTEQAIPRGSRT